MIVVAVAAVGKPMGNTHQPTHIPIPTWVGTDPWWVWVWVGLWVPMGIPMLFPTAGWQVSVLCNGVLGSITPWVTLNSMNNTDLNSQYHDFRTFTNNSHQDMTIMHWNNHVGYIGVTHPRD